MRKFIYVTMPIVFFACGGIFFNARADDLIYYQNGQSEKLSADRMPKILTISDELISNIDDAFSLIVTDKTIDELKNGRCLEIILSDKREVKPNDFIQQGFTYHKLLLPIYDDERSMASVLYFGNQKAYYTPPYVNKNGRKYLDEIMKIIGK